VAAPSNPIGAASRLNPVSIWDSIGTLFSICLSRFRQGQFLCGEVDFPLFKEN
jgi:hypothetical protein